MKQLTTAKYIDIEVGERLLKAVDGLVLFPGALLFSLMATKNLQAENATALVGFFAITTSLLAMITVRSVGTYNPKNWHHGLACFANSLAAMVIVGLAAFYLFSLTVLPMNPIWGWYWVGLATAHTAVTRFGAQLWFGSKSNGAGFRKHVVIVGGGKAAEETLDTLEKSKVHDFEIVGLFDDRNDVRSPESIRKHQKLGSISDLANYARNHRVDLIIVAIPLSAEARLLQILKRLWELPMDIRISGQSSTLKLSRRAYTYLGDLPLLSAFDRPLNGWGLLMKSVMDRIIASVAIVALAPVMLAVAVAVRYESKGPIIFKQRRYGFNNQLVEVYKFRSMYTDKTDAAATKLVTKNDSRVTKVGRIIRKTSLDELPQLFNVLSGQLSLVGPRPHATQAKAADTLYEQVVDGYFARHKVKPGITGWAQINGWRGETDTREKLEQRVKFDLEYIDQWSLGFDLLILARTPFALIKSENAY